MNPLIWRLIADYYNDRNINKMSDKDLSDIVDVTQEFKKDIVDLTNEELGIYFDKQDADRIASEYLRYAGPKDKDDSVGIGYEVGERLKSIVSDQGYGSYDKAYDFVNKWFDLEEPSKKKVSHSRRGGGGGALPQDLTGSGKTLPRGLVRRDKRKY
jgi:hypothetical protein|tara:strand:- start:1330 stop:1797 length:468 start_codon:yes stop_codon:yes gene_type:complete